MLRIQALTDDGLRYVLANLWERGRRELDAFGVAYEAVYPMLATTIGHPYSFEVRDGETPVIAMGANAMAPGHYFTWMLATEAFSAYGAALTRLVRSKIGGEMAKRPGAVLDLVSASEHPSADIWFRLLGFKPAGVDGKLRRYRYVSKFASDNAGQSA